MFERMIVILTILLILFYSPNININKSDSDYLNSVFQLFVIGDDVSTGTAFSVKYKKNKSLILTNFHVCKGAIFDEKEIIVSNGIYDGSDIYFAKVVKFSISKDLCLLESDIPSKKFKIKSKCSKKERAVVVGAPNGVFPIILDSYISKYKIEKEEIPFKEIDSDSEIMMLSQMFLPGHSGSPVISKDGKVCGIVFAASNAGYGGFAMSGREIISFINSYSDF